MILARRSTGAEYSERGVEDKARALAALPHLDDREAALTGHLNLDGTATEEWKFEVVSTGPVAVGGS